MLSPRSLQFAVAFGPMLGFAKDPQANQDPWVSTAVTWQELEQMRKKDDPVVLRFSPDAVLKRVEKSAIFSCRS